VVVMCLPLIRVIDLALVLLFYVVVMLCCVVVVVVVVVVVFVVCILPILDGIQTVAVAIRGSASFTTSRSIGPTSSPSRPRPRPTTAPSGKQFREWGTNSNGISTHRKGVLGPTNCSNCFQITHI
jgi:hypothetical protein